MILRLAIFLKRIVWFVWGLFVLRSSYWAGILTKYHLRPDCATTLQSRSLLHLSDIDLTLKKNVNLHIFEAFQDAQRLYQWAGARFLLDDHDRLVVQVDDLRFFAPTAQVIQILKEVYVAGIYNIEIPDPAVIIDIGMNVGIVSLFLAARLKAPVFAYEPFRQTYTHAINNFALNKSELSDRIRHFNYGLGATRTTVEAVFCPEASGDCGVIPIPPGYHQGRERRLEVINIFPITDVIDLVCKEFPERNILLKIDCEGSEYEIIKSLNQSGYLKRVSAIMLEWHRRAPSHDPAGIVDLLVQRGFIVFSRGCLAAQVGMIYASGQGKFN